MNDLELLRQFARDGSQAAFQAVVSRHFDLVYSAAKRQVRSPDLAKDVAQAVFLDLATSASNLRADTVLASWLFVATRRRAIDVVRREVTRQRIERAAAEEHTVNAPQSSWSQREPLLDEALTSLREEDRRALLLRFFENQNLREISLALGCSEDSAQKRVSRALDRLRGYFSERGLLTVAAVLASELSTHAVERAPSGAAASVASSVLTRIASTAAQHAARIAIVGAMKVAAMTVALAGAAIFVAYESYAYHQRRLELASLIGATEQWRRELRSLQSRAATERAVRAEASARREEFISADPEFDQRIRTALVHLAELRRRFDAVPREQIPEMRYLTFEHWFDIAQSHVKWDTAEDWREIMSSVRTRAINWSGDVLASALERYVTHSHGLLPKTMDDLAPFCDPALEPDILARYELKKNTSIADLPQHATIIAQKNDTVVDPDHDNLAVIGLHWSGVTGVRKPNSLNAKLEEMTKEAVAAYQAAHGGKTPDANDPEVLRPYFSNPQKGEAYVAIVRTLLAEMPYFKEENAIGLATNGYTATHHGQEPKSPEELAPYFKYPEDAAVYLNLVTSGQLR